MNDYSVRGCRVLLAEASSRQVLPMLYAFRRAGCRVTTVQEHKSDLGCISKYPQEKLTHPGVDTDRKAAEPFYRELLQNRTYDIVVPLSDFSASLLSEMKVSVEKGGTTAVAVNEPDIFMKAYDKAQTMKICMEHQIPCPYTLDDVYVPEDIPEDAVYPLVIKPRSSCGSIGFHIASDREELAAYMKELNGSESGGFLIQEYIPQTGKQYNAHFVIDAKHTVKTAILTQKCRWLPLDGGASTLCRTVHDPKILADCKKLLQAIGWIGYCDIDLMEDPRDGSVRIIEINGRISANIKICFLAGADIARQLLQLYSGQEVDSYPDYPEDVRLRCIHTDFLWFLKSHDRFKTEPKWFSFRRTSDQIFSLRDPIPFFVFSFLCLFRYRKEMKKRRR